MFFRSLIFSTLLFVLIGITPAAHAQSAEVGIMLTRMQAIMAQMDQLYAEFQTLATKLGQTPTVLGATVSTPIFSDSLTYGETNNDIKRIQELLAIDPEIYPYGVASGFFGPKTEEAIKNLQTRFDLDPVGVIGPATRALLEGYLRAYPDGKYPAGLLNKKPPIASTATPQPQAAASTPTVATSANNPASSIEAWFEDDETWIDITFNDGRKMMRIARDGEDENDVIEFVAEKTGLTESQVRELITFEGKKARTESSSSDSDVDEQDAEDAVDDAKDAIDDADDDIDAADEDGDEVDWAKDTLREARKLWMRARDAQEDGHYSDAIEDAEDAEKLAKRAEDRIGKEEGDDNDEEIEEIRVEIDDDEAFIDIEFEDGSSKSYTLRETDEDTIIEKLADKLNVSERDIENVIEFD